MSNPLHWWSDSDIRIPSPAGSVANVGIKGPPAYITFQWSFRFDIRVMSPRLGQSRMSNPLHWSPWRDAPLEPAQQRRERDAENAERHDRDEHLVDLIGGGGAHDQISDARDRGVLIGQYHAD